MKNIIRIPLEQFAYLETEFIGTPDEALVEYRRLTNLYKNPSQTSENGSGLTQNEYARVYDSVACGTGGYTEEQRAKMSAQQKFSIHDLEKSLERFKNKK